MNNEYTEKYGTLGYMLNNNRRGRASNDPTDSGITHQILVSRSYNLYTRKLDEMVMSMFIWEGLPDTMSRYHLERDLVNTGVAVIAEHKNGNIVNLKLGAEKGVKEDVYGESPYVELMGHKYQETYHRDDISIVYNNANRLGTRNTIDYIAIRLAELDRAIAQNLSQQSIPYIISGPATLKNDLLKIFKAAGDNSPAIVMDKSMKEKIDISVGDTRVAYIIDKLAAQKHTVWNEGMTFLGVDNANQNKQERMITGEVDSNDGQINLFRNSMLNERQKAAERANELFGTNITVKFNDGIFDELDKMLTLAHISELITEADKNEAQADEARANALENKESGENED